MKKSKAGGKVLNSPRILQLLIATILRRIGRHLERLAASSDSSMVLIGPTVMSFGSNRTLQASRTQIALIGTLYTFPQSHGRAPRRNCRPLQSRAGSAFRYGRARKPHFPRTA